MTAQKYSLEKAKLPKFIRRVIMIIYKNAISEKELHKLHLMKNAYLLELQNCPSPRSTKVRTELIQRIAKSQQSDGKLIPSLSTILRWEHSLPIAERKFPQANK